MNFSKKTFFGLLASLVLIYNIIIFKHAQENSLYSQPRISARPSKSNRISITSQIISKNILTDKLDEFFQTHNKISFIEEQNSLKKISFNEGGGSKEGYGNRLNSIMSSLLIAILIDGQLMVKWPEIESFVNLPIKVFTNKSVLRIDPSYKYVKPSQSWLIKKEITKLMNSSLSPNQAKYVNEDGATYFMELCANPAYFNKLSYYGLVRDETIQSALEVVRKGNDFTENEKQERIFQIGFEVGGNLLNRFWRPNQQIMNDVEAYLSEMFKNKIVIGFQLRYLYLNDYDQEKFINCALDVEQEYLLSDKNLSSNSFKWFLTGDSQEKMDLIIKKYPQKAFSTSKYPVGHIGEENKGFHRTILDVELLSKCNELIFTGGSTYGWIAAMKMLSLPLYIEGKNLTSITMKKCVRSTFSEPPSWGPNKQLPFERNAVF